MTDEIMMEVHAIKDAIGVRNGHNLDALFKEIQLGEARLKAVGVKVLAPPSIQQICLPLHCSVLASLTEIERLVFNIVFFPAEINSTLTPFGAPVAARARKIAYS